MERTLRHYTSKPCVFNRVCILAACSVRYAIASMRTNVPTLAPQLLRSRLTKVCVAIIGTTPAEMIEKATAAVKENSFLEFRLDYLDKPLLALPRFKQFFADNMAATAIATCRRATNGGKLPGSVVAEQEILIKAAEAGFLLVDLELESAQTLKKAGVQKLRDTGAALIISHHDFNATKDLDGIYARIAPFNPDFVKIRSEERRVGKECRSRWSPYH